MRSVIVIVNKRIWMNESITKFSYNILSLIYFPYYVNAVHFVAVLKYLLNDQDLQAAVDSLFNRKIVFT